MCILTPVDGYNAGCKICPFLSGAIVSLSIYFLPQ